MWIFGMSTFLILDGCLLIHSDCLEETARAEPYMHLVEHWLWIMVMDYSKLHSLTAYEYCSLCLSYSKYWEHVKTNIKSIYLRPYMPEVERSLGITTRKGQMSSIKDKHPVMSGHIFKPACVRRRPSGGAGLRRWRILWILPSREISARTKTRLRKCPPIQIHRNEDGRYAKRT